MLNCRVFRTFSSPQTPVFPLSYFALLRRWVAIWVAITQSLRALAFQPNPSLGQRQRPGALLAEMKANEQRHEGEKREANKQNFKRGGDPNLAPEAKSPPDFLVMLGAYTMLLEYLVAQLDTADSRYMKVYSGSAVAVVVPISVVIPVPAGVHVHIAPV